METYNPNQQQLSEKNQTINYQLCREIIEFDLEQIFLKLGPNNKESQIIKQNNQDQGYLFLAFVEKNNQKIYKQKQYTCNKTQNNYIFHHVQVHKQVIGNLCGYHALFNLIQAVNLIKNQDINAIYKLNDSIYFWQFFFQTTAFLWDFVRQNNYDTSKSPWKNDEVHRGDFERGYLKILCEHNKQFVNAFSDKHQDPLFAVSSVTLSVWPFQFSKTCFANETDCLIVKKNIEDFLQFKEKNIHKISCFLLGVTTHWAGLLAHKYNDKIEFWLFDSKLKNYLDRTEEQIEQLIEQKNKKYKLRELPPLTQFQVYCYKNQHYDLQKSVELLCHLLLGNIQLDILILNEQFDVFGQGIRKQFKDIQDIQLFLNNSSNYEQAQSILDLYQNWITEFYIDLVNFFLNQSGSYNQLNKENKENLNFISALNQCCLNLINKQIQLKYPHKDEEISEEQVQLEWDQDKQLFIQEQASLLQNFLQEYMATAQQQQMQ